MRHIGFSTGAIARGDFRSALALIRRHNLEVVELSALRFGELRPLVEAIGDLDLSGFRFVSIHAPSKFSPHEEPDVLRLLCPLADQGFHIVAHPDTIFNPANWRALGDRLLIENLDKRKPVGRTVAELAQCFRALPEAQFCFDIGHARQVDPSMTEAALLLSAFHDRLAEVHMSEVNTASRHDPLSMNAVMAFSAIMAAVPEDIPIILETLIDQGQSDVQTEVRRANEVFCSAAV
ncbi:MAG TPA: hypothetical protein VGL53_12065 [Bryobacteraceae bacterium]